MIRNILTAAMLAAAFTPAALTGAESQALTPDRMVAMADSAYAADDFAMAAAAYESAITAGATSAPVYYNLGNACYRDGRLGKAVVAYERALKIDPTYSDARFNLQFVRTRLLDRQPETDNAVGLFFKKTGDLMTPDGWAWTGTALFIICLGLIAVYLYTSPVPLRKFGFFGAIIALPLAIAAYILAVRSTNEAKSHDRAIVESASLMVSTAPRTPKDRSEEVALLHEGTKVEVIDSLKVMEPDSASTRWFKVVIPTGLQGWVSEHGVEII